jgi:hypothetical protein
MRTVPLILVCAGCARSAARPPTGPSGAVAVEQVVATETGGFVVVEAERFTRQTRHDKRAWYVTSASAIPAVGPDIDSPHLEGASGGAYIEVLPDTGVDGTSPIHGENFSDKPGEMAVLSYPVKFTTAGRYYIWARAFATDGDDNTLHFGLDESWPESSARQHTFTGKAWRWASRHRHSKGKIYFDVPTPGIHVVNVSMREDGCELDQFVLTTREDYLPPGEAGTPVRFGQPSSRPATSWSSKPSPCTQRRAGRCPPRLRVLRERLARMDPRGWRGSTSEREAASPRR